jgi:DNA-binding response OmpR family regulator
METTDMETSDPVVLIVEDEIDVATTYKYWLTEDYEIRHAASGEEALANLSSEIDVVLLDRMMPGLSGGEVLEEIRNRGVDCRVAMVTAADPGIEIIEMGFDEYVTKPPDREQLRETVQRLLDRAHLGDELQEYYALVSKQAALETELSAAEREASDDYADLVERTQKQRTRLDQTTGEMDSHADFVGAMRELTDEPAAASSHTSDTDTDDL